jgi:hypothetical protein
MVAWPQDKELIASQRGLWRWIWMGFFDNIAPKPDGGTMRALPRPSGQVPTPLAIRLMLARTSQVAVAVVGVWAFTTGFDLQINAELRNEIPGTSTASFLAGLDDEPLEDEFCRLGVQFSTGEKAANLERGSDTAGPIMKVMGGGGGLLFRQWRYWISPLPPSGPLTFACEWPALGVAESRAEIDAQPILDAASQSIVLWPDPSDSVCSDPSQ